MFAGWESVADGPSVLRLNEHAREFQRTIPGNDNPVFTSFAKALDCRRPKGAPVSRR